MREDLPSGTVSFLFTDVEGSTKLLHELGPADYADALADHRRVLREAFHTHGGVEVDTRAMPSSSPSRPREARSRQPLLEQALGPEFETLQGQGRQLNDTEASELALQATDRALGELRKET